MVSGVQYSRDDSSRDEDMWDMQRGRSLGVTKKGIRDVHVYPHAAKIEEPEYAYFVKGHVRTYAMLCCGCFRRFLLKWFNVWEIRFVFSIYLAEHCKKTQTRKVASTPKTSSLNL